MRFILFLRVCEKHRFPWEIGDCQFLVIIGKRIFVGCRSTISRVRLYDIVLSYLIFRLHFLSRYSDLPTIIFLKNKKNSKPSISVFHFLKIRSYGVSSVEFHPHNPTQTRKTRIPMIVIQKIIQSNN